MAAAGETERSTIGCCSVSLSERSEAEDRLMGWKFSSALCCEGLRSTQDLRWRLEMTVRMRLRREEIPFVAEALTAALCLASQMSALASVKDFGPVLSSRSGVDHERSAKPGTTFVRVNNL